MELLTPGFGLIVWQVVALLYIALLIASWIFILGSKVMSPTTKMIWMIGTFLFPIFGPVFLFFSAKKNQKLNSLKYLIIAFAIVKFNPHKLMNAKES